MAEHDRLHSVGRELQKRWLFLKRRALGSDILLGAVCLAFLLTLLIMVFAWPLSLLWAYVGIAGLALTVWSILSWQAQVTPLAVLITADRTLGLNECLSTAYEYEQEKPENQFLPGLKLEAEKAASRVDPRIVFSSRFPRRIWVIPLMLAALVGFLRFEMLPFQFDIWTQVDDVFQEVEREGKRLENWGRRLEQLAEQEQLDRSLILARHIKELGRRLQRERDGTDQASERISTLSQYLQRMHQKLQERALISESGLLMVEDVLASGKSVKQELQDILLLLQDDQLPYEMKSLAERGVQRLSRQLGDIEELSQLLQDLQAGNVKAARQLIKDLLQQQQVAEEIEHLDRARRVLQYASRALKNQKPTESLNKAQPSRGQQSSRMGESFDFDDETMSEDMPGLEDFYTPGIGVNSGTATYENTGPEQGLRESEQPVSNVRVKSGEGRMRLRYIRHLPLQNEAQAPVRQAVVKYQRAAEESLSQEQIPRGYRDQIKQYFLAIGMAAPEATGIERVK